MFCCFRWLFQTAYQERSRKQVEKVGKKGLVIFAQKFHCIVTGD